MARPRPLGQGGSGGTLPRKILKFYSRRDVFSCILKLQTMSFIYQKKMTFPDNLISSQSTVLFAMRYGGTHNKQGDFISPVIRWKFDGKVCFTFEKTH